MVGAPDCELISNLETTHNRKFVRTTRKGEYEIPLVDVLRRFDCSAYESKAYMALVQGGPMRPVDLARRSGIPSGRIYDILKSLDRKGFVRKQGIRPAMYDAEHPRTIVNVEMQKIQESADQALPDAEAAYDVRRGEREELLGNTWSVSGYAGFAREVKNNVTSSVKSLHIFDSDLTWITPRDVAELRKALGRGIQIYANTTSRSQESLRELGSGGVKVKVVAAKVESYYVFDERRVLLRLHNPDGAVVFDDETIAKILINHHSGASPERGVAK